MNRIPKFKNTFVQSVNLINDKKFGDRNEPEVSNIVNTIPINILINEKNVNNLPSSTFDSAIVQVSSESILNQ